MCAGTPTTVEFGGTSVRTTEPAPTREFWPMVMLPRTLALLPTKTPSQSVGCRFPWPFAGAAERDALIERDVAADDGGLADDDARGVIDEEPAAQQRAGVDIDAGKEAGELRKEPRAAAAASSARADAKRDETRQPTGPDSKAGLRAGSAQRGRAPAPSERLRESG